MMERGLFIWLVALCGMACWWPAPFVATGPALMGMIAATMFAIGTLLPAREIAQLGQRWPTVLGGTTVQYAAMPALAVAVVWLFDLRGAYAVGTILVGCVPGAMASNVLTLSSRGNVSYSVSLTTSATLLSPLVVPITLGLTLGRQEQLPGAMQQILTLMWTVVVPVLVGHALARWSRRVTAVAHRVASPLAHGLILWIIATVVARVVEAHSVGRLLDGVWATAGPLLAINLLGFGAGWLGGWAMRLDGPMRRALTLEVGMQNAGLGAVLAAQWFADTPEAAIPPALYTFGCMLTGTLLATYWSFRPVGTVPPADTSDSG